ncbi:MAG: NUDIX domain-containing protein [Rickettsiales bacterium]|jgi:isopentenyldiphosphate isomerase|nr:NUDIX domain-containing protein [Rickettsiales bacterium]
MAVDTTDMTELLDVYDADRNWIGVADRNVVHTFGLWHKTIHCWLAMPSENGGARRIVFQRRAANKTDGNKFYTTASGHLTAGDSVDVGFMRELQEEIGLNVSDLTPHLISEGVYVCNFRKSGEKMFDRVFPSVYWAEFSGDLSDLKFNDGEVASVASIDTDDFMRLMNGLTETIPAREWTGAIMRDIMVGINDFVLQDGETLETKYGHIARAIKNAE